MNSRKPHNVAILLVVIFSLVFSGCGKTGVESIVDSMGESIAESSADASSEVSSEAVSSEDTSSKPTVEESLPVNGELIKYPEYSEDVMPRNFDYTVKIKQGSRSIVIPVYDPVFASDYFNGSTKGYDMHRRYAEFAFSGDPITVEITVNRDFRSYSIMPSSRQISSEINGNVITYTLDKPQTTVFKINEDRDTMLTIFADEPEKESDIPDKNASNVIYFEPGYHEVEGGVLKLGANTHVYLAPGALVKSRIYIGGDNVTVSGNGAFIEPSPTRMPVNSIRYMCNTTSSSNILIKDVRMLDSHDFNITMTGGKNKEFDGVKVLSNQISTDGFSIWGGCDGVNIHDCYFGISDNVFVIGGGKMLGFKAENCIVASDYAIFFPQGDLSGETLVFKNIDVLRCGSFLKETYPSDDKDKHADVYMENIYAVDVDKPCRFIWFSKLGSGTKTYVMKNVSAPVMGNEGFTFTDDVRDTNFTIDNVWVGKKQFTSLNVLSNNVNQTYNKFTFTSASDGDAVFVGKKSVVKLEKTYTAEKVFVGGLYVDTMYAPYNDNGTIMVSANEILKELAFEDIKFDGKKLSFKYGKETYEATAGSTSAVANGKQVTLSVAPIAKENRLVVATSFFNEVLNTSVKYEASTKRTTVANIFRGGNLLRNPGIESGLSMDWVTRNFTYLYLSNDSHSGNNSIRLQMDQKHPYYGGNNGIYQDIIEVLRKYGNGNYKITAWVKKADPSCDSTSIYLGVTTQYSFDTSSAAKIKLTNEWQKIEYTYTLSKDPTYIDGAFLLIGYIDGTNKNVLVDDISMEKM